MTLEEMRDERNRLLNPDCLCQIGRLKCGVTDVVAGPFRVFPDENCPVHKDDPPPLSLDDEQLAEANEKYPYRK